VPADRFDVAVIGAGVFGAWTAHHLHRAGKSVALIDAYGPGNGRASSGGESRFIRAGYGPREIYTRWSVRALSMYREFAAQTDPTLFRQTGLLWIAPESDPFTLATEETLAHCGIPFGRLDRAELQRRYAQFHVDAGEYAIFEPDAGVLMARRAVETLVRRLTAEGVPYRRAAATAHAAPIDAGVYVYACGPWLPKLFPDLLGDKIRPTRQEVFFFGPPPGDPRFTSPVMPGWIHVGEKTYGMPDLESRGVKVASDLTGSVVDPDTEERIVSAEALREARNYITRRFPAMAGAPLLDSRVCQYENTATGDYLIDRHPDRANVWLVGGGSGHGYKHGPVVGEYVARLIVDGGETEERFSLAAKASFPAPQGHSSFYRQ
jgi:sarcosine oxidase